MKKPSSNAEIITEILTGKTPQRRAQRAANEQRRINDHSRPKWWVHAHINTRAGNAPGHLADLVVSGKQDPAQARDWADYLDETRRMRTTR